jgi:hypothetical protein
MKTRRPSAEASEQAAAAALTLQLLAFVAEGNRTYGETMEAWRSTCPRMPIWEDAVRNGLVRVENGSAMKSSCIVLTTRGRARLGQTGRRTADSTKPEKAKTEDLTKPRSLAEAVSGDALSRS